MENNCNTKINKFLIIIGAIGTIIPFNVVIQNSATSNNMLLYLPMFIGYMLYFTQYEICSDKQKKLFKIALCMGMANIISGLWNEFDENFSFARLIFSLVFYISYCVHRIFSLLLCIDILKDKWSKSKVIIAVIMVIIGFVFLLRVCSNYPSFKSEKTFGDNYCRGEHYKGEFVRKIPWKCKLCGFSTDVINPDENVPIICFGCSVSTGRCMECGLLEEK